MLLSAPRAAMIVPRLPAAEAGAGGTASGGDVGIVGAPLGRALVSALGFPESQPDCSVLWHTSESRTTGQGTKQQGRSWDCSVPEVGKAL